jgi:hypothetical protein
MVPIAIGMLENFYSSFHVANNRDLAEIKNPGEEP